MRCAVLTSMLTTQPDPQRGSQLPPHLDVVAPLIRSLRGRPLTIFVDQPLALGDREMFPGNVEMEHVPAFGGNPYRERWRHARNWLARNRDVHWVWCVDATDVVMLRDPFPHMVEHVLYVGSEPTTVGDAWLGGNHPGVRSWAGSAAHKALPLLNGGLLGGDAVTVLGFLSCLVDHLDQPKHSRDMTDMGALNELAWTWFAPRIVTGPQVHTVFRAEDHSNGYSWWAHK